MKKQSMRLGVLSLLLAGSCFADPDMRAAFGVEDIQIGGIIGERINRTIYGNLLKVDFDTPDFLADFQPDSRVDHRHPYTGLGMSMVSCVYFAAYTNDPAVVVLKDHLIDRIIASQDPDGYIGLHATPEMKRRVEKYVYHELAYILQALVADYEIFGRENSLEAARKLGDWSIANWGTADVFPHLWGYEGAMLDLGRASGDERYSDFIKTTFMPDGEIAPVWRRVLQLENGIPHPVNRHAYNYLAASMVMLELNDLQSNQQLHLGPNKALNHLKQGGSMPPGVFTWSEHWTKSQFGRDAVNNPSVPFADAWRTGENCPQCYLEHFLDTLQQYDPQAWNGDVMERTLYNAIFGGQSKDGRRIRYGTPVEGQRFYFPTDRMCCPNNFRLGVSKIPAWFYYTGTNSVLMNLYGESDATLSMPGAGSVRLVQKTAYPFQGDVTVSVGLETPKTFDLKFRIPAWTEGANPSVQVNGQPVGQVTPGTILSLKREWRDGDTVVLDFPLRNRWVAGHSEQEGRTVLMRGPIVYCVNPLLNGIDGYEDLVGEGDVYDYFRIINSERPGYAEWFKKELGYELPDYEKSYAVLQKIRLKASSLSAPFADDTFFELGNAMTVDAWSDATTEPSVAPDLQLKLTPFADPGGRKIFFLTDTTVPVRLDELFGVPDFNIPYEVFHMDKPVPTAPVVVPAAVMPPSDPASNTQPIQYTWTGGAETDAFDDAANWAMSEDTTNTYIINNGAAVATATSPVDIGSFVLAGGSTLTVSTGTVMNVRLNNVSGMTGSGHLVVDGSLDFQKLRWNLGGVNRDFQVTVNGTLSSLGNFYDGPQANSTRFNINGVARMLLSTFGTTVNTKSHIISINKGGLFRTFMRIALFSKPGGYTAIELNGGDLEFVATMVGDGDDYIYDALNDGGIIFRDVDSNLILEGDRREDVATWIADGVLLSTVGDLAVGYDSNWNKTRVMLADPAQ